jgi:hypothetical protein
MTFFHALTIDSVFFENSTNLPQKPSKLTNQRQRKSKKILPNSSNLDASSFVKFEKFVFIFQPYLFQQKISKHRPQRATRHWWMDTATHGLTPVVSTKRAVQNSSRLSIPCLAGTDNRRFAMYSSDWILRRFESIRFLWISNSNRIQRPRFASLKLFVSMTCLILYQNDLIMLKIVNLNREI